MFTRHNNNKLEILLINLGEIIMAKYSLLKINLIYLSTRKKIESRHESRNTFY